MGSFHPVGFLILNRFLATLQVQLFLVDEGQPGQKDHDVIRAVVRDSGNLVTGTNAAGAWIDSDGLVNYNSTLGGVQVINNGVNQLVIGANQRVIGEAYMSLVHEGF